MDKIDENKINNLIQKGIQDYMNKSQYSVTKIPSHIHNGVDSNRISQSDIIPSPIYSGFLVEDVTENFTLQTTKQITRLNFSGFAANNAGKTGTFTGTLAIGDTSATLSTTWNYATQVISITFSNTDVRSVTFTNASNALTWVGGLSAGATATFTYPSTSTQKAIINGEVCFGTVYSFYGSGTNIRTGITNVTYQFLQTTNDMYIDTTDLTKTRVSASNTPGLAAAFGFVYVTDSSGAVVAQLNVTAYTNNKITIASIIGTNWKIQGGLTLT